MSRKQQPVDPQYWVSAIEFDADCVLEKGKGAVYVGQTALMPEERLARQPVGGKVAANIFKAGKAHSGTNLRLRMDLATMGPNHGGPRPSHLEALPHERRLATRGT